MIFAKSMEVRENFKKWCVEVNEGETVRISRPKSQDVYLIGADEYAKLSLIRRVSTYGSYFYGKDKITNLKRISDIEKLENNWNNNGAGAFDEQLIKMVRQLAISFEIQPEIFPTANNSIQFEWDKDDGEYLELEVCLDGINVFVIDKDGNEKSFEMTIDKKECNRLVEQFFDETI